MPWMAGIQKEMIKDIAIMTGAKVVDNEHTLKIEDVRLQDLGEAKVIKSDAEFTHIVGGSFT